MDIVIVITFLVVNLIIGLYASKNINTIKDYAIGSRNFSTATITATIVATWIFGSSVSINLLETYNNGLFFVLPAIADGFSFFIIAYFYAPRMSEFLGKLSVAEAMGSLYGKHVRIITAISGIIPAIGNIAMQFSILAILLNYLFDTSSSYSLVISGLIVITYSSFGGIKAVTFTDMIQFFTFGVIIPMMAFLIWNSLDNTKEIWNVLNSNPLFDYKEVFNIHNSRFLSTLLLFLFFMLPGLDPALFQRIAMAKNTIQVSKSFVIAGVIIICCYLILDFAGLLLLADNVTNINQDNILQYVLDNYFHTGFKGLLIVGIMAMIMSTADSYINTSSVLFSYDFCSSLGLKLSEQKELLLARISSIFIGISALMLSLFSHNLLEVILSAYSFYMPIVSVPLILAIFGFRSSSKAVLIGMLVGFITVLSFKLFFETDSMIPGMLANLIFFIGSHYVLREPGGWVGIKETASLDTVRVNRKRTIKRIVQSIVEFNLLKSFKDNLPKEEKIQVYFGLFCVISIFSNAYSLPKILAEQYANILYPIYYSTLILSTIFITYPLWLQRFKNQSFKAILWNLAIFYNLAFSSSLLVVLSKFSSIQITILMANLITISILLRWEVALLMILGGFFTSIQFYKYYMGELALAEELSNLQFKIVYLLLLVCSVLIAFLKPKQEQQALSELKIDYLGSKIDDQEQELIRSQELKYEFLRNLEHEVYTPIIGITSLGQVLWDNYDQLSEKERRKATKEIAKNSDRLRSLVSNMVDLSKLSSLSYKLNIEEVNLTELVYERVEICKKLYITNQDQDLQQFFLIIEDNITANCDKYYISRTIDNIVINSIQYCKQGTIMVKLVKNKSNIEFSVEDEGIGIPKEELYHIFGIFIVSSRTKTSSGGRGIGLALCKKAINLHGGEIWVESNGTKGAVFKFILPTIIK